MFAANGSFVDLITSFQEEDAISDNRHLKQINEYSLCAKVGSGSFSSVFLGVHMKTNQKYAIKRIRLRKLARTGDSLAELEREIRLMRSFSHPNILKLMEVLHIQSTDDVFLVLEYAEKGCLRGFLDRGQHISTSSVLSILKQMIRAVQYLHDTGHVHQDIKPGNILLDADGRAILGDFGNGHSFRSAAMVIGSPAYQAPEALDDSYWNGEEDFDLPPEKEDIWALGVTFYQLLFERLPFPGENLYEIVNQIKSGPVEIPDGTDGAISELLRGMLTIDPIERLGGQELLTHPLISNAADRASDLPSVPELKGREGLTRNVRARVCPIDFSFSEILQTRFRRSFAWAEN
jgi:serine/threonine protein kinase